MRGYTLLLAAICGYLLLSCGTDSPEPFGESAQGTNTVEPTETPSLVPNSTATPEPTLTPVAPTLVPTLEPTWIPPTPTPFLPTRIPSVPFGDPTYAGHITHYGESYNGQTMGCGGTYWSTEPNIVAVGPMHYAEWPCGTQFEITGPGGTLVAMRTDSCPGCGFHHFDLSEIGSYMVCGYVGNCEITFQVRVN